MDIIDRTKKIHFTFEKKGELLMSRIAIFQDCHWIPQNVMDIGGRKVSIFLGTALVLIGFGLNGCASKEEPEEPGRYYGKSYSIKFPDKWILDDDFDRKIAKALIPKETTDNQFRFRININVIDNDKGGGLNLEKEYQRSQENLSEILTEFQIYEEGRIMIDDVVSKWHIYSYKLGPLDVKTLQYLFKKGRRFYTITCGAGVDEFDQYRNTFEEVAQSFKFK
jgi:hypothetical protein